MDRNRFLPVLFTTTLLLCNASLFARTLAQNTSSTHYQFRAAFYNVENFFDTVDDPSTRDEDFTPLGNYQWDMYRYDHKAENISKIIATLEKDGKAIGLLGLCEIENKAVLRRLLNTDSLRNKNYGYLHVDSGDARGIDVALLFDRSFFVPLSYKPLRTDKHHRDILYCKGLTTKGDTLHVFVNHWPSRLGGQKATEPQRLAQATLLSKSIDSLATLPHRAPVLVMGDFNDTPEDKSILALLHPSSGLVCHGDITSGTYHFEQRWYALDLIFTNFAGEGKRLTVFREPFLLGENHLPWRTFQGPIYRGGFSDHLPVFMDLAL